MELQTQLETVRNHKGTVRVTIGNYTVNADVLETTMIREPFNDGKNPNPGILQAGLRLRSTQDELIRMQEEAIDSLLIEKYCCVVVLAQTKSSWYLQDTIELLQTEQGDFTWQINARIFL